MEWNFVNMDDGTFFRLLIQAKRAYGDGSKWQRHCYRELFHLSGNSGKLQGEVLCDTARAQPATFPLYAFYHPLMTCSLAQNGGIAAVDGVNLADGYLVEALIKGAIGRIKRTRNKSLGAMHPHLFPLSTLFCPPLVQPIGPMARIAPRDMTPFVISPMGIGVPLPPRPTDIRQRLAEWRKTVTGARQTVQEFPSELPELPEVGTAIPEDVKALIHLTEIDGDRERREYSHKWRVTFLSSNPREDRGDISPTFG